LRKLLLGIIVALLVISPVAAAPADPYDFDSYVILREDPATLNYGDTVSFNVRFPQEAAKHKRAPQFEEAPIIQINCFPYETGTWDYLAQTWTEDRWKVTGGWEGYTYPRPLNSYWPRDGRKWLSGGASCSAILFNANIENGQLVFDVWATTRFTVAP